MISLLTWYFDCYFVEKWHKNTYFWKVAWFLVKWTNDMMNLCTHYEKTYLTFQISRWTWDIWVLHPQVSKQNSVNMNDFKVGRCFPTLLPTTAIYFTATLAIYLSTACPAKMQPSHTRMYMFNFFLINKRNKVVRLVSVSSSNLSALACCKIAF